MAFGGDLYIDTDKDIYRYIFIDQKRWFGGADRAKGSVRHKKIRGTKKISFSPYLIIS